MKFHSWALAFAALAAQPATAATQLEAKLILDVGRVDSKEGMLFHNNTLWTGTEHTESGYGLAAFKADGQSLGTVALDHSVAQVFPFDATSVIVTGNAVVELGQNTPSCPSIRSSVAREIALP